MRFNDFTMIGEYRSHDINGSSIVYNKGDVVEIDSNYYICTGANVVSNPLSNANNNWITLSETQVFFATTNEPFFSKSGDEWLNMTTGIKYKRVSDNNGTHWVEI